MGREDVLYEAYRRCRANRGAPGVDGESFKDIEADGLASWLQRLKQELRTKQYRCAPLLRVWIPKANGGTAGARTDLRSRPVPLAVRLARGHGRQDGTSAHSLRGIFAERTPTFDLQTRPYRRDRLVLVVPARHALAACGPATLSGLADLLDFDFDSLPQQTSLAQRLRAESTSIGRRLRVRIQVRSFDTMCQMMAAGLGIAVLPDAAVQPHLRSMGLARIELPGAWVEREMLIGMRDVAALARPARMLLDHLVYKPVANASSFSPPTSKLP